MNSRDVEKDGLGLRNAGPEGTLVRGEGRRLVGPWPEGPCELTGNKLGGYREWKEARGRFWKNRALCNHWE